MKSKKLNAIHPKTSMSREIEEQPAAWMRVMDAIAEQASGSSGRGRRLLGKIRRAQRRIFVGSGSSFHAAVAGARAFSNRGLPAHAVRASLALRSEAQTQEKTILVALSHSGASSDLLDVLARAEARGIETVAMSNLDDSPALKRAQWGVSTRAGVEHAIPSTKGFTSLVLASQCLAAQASEPESPNASAQLARAVRRLNRALEQHWPVVDPGSSLVARLASSRLVFVLGDEWSYPAALDGALKLAEVCTLPALAYPYGEFFHGPVALADQRASLICLEPSSDWLDEARLAQARASGTNIVGVSHESFGETRLSHWIPSTASSPEMRVLALSVTLQLLVHAVGESLGTPIDSPRLLTKVVESEGSPSRRRRK